MWEYCVAGWSLSGYRQEKQREVRGSYRGLSGKASAGWSVCLLVTVSTGHFDVVGL